MDELLTQQPLDETCALQWQRSVQRSAYTFEQMDPSRSVEGDYESFVSYAKEQRRQIISLAGIEASVDQVAAAVSGVRAESVEKWRVSLGYEAIERLPDFVGTTFDRFGY